MNWYYESGGQQQGPVADSELDRLLGEGKITLDTLVWREGLTGWTPLRTARPAAPPSPVAPVDAGWELTRPAAPAAAATAGSDVAQPGWIRCTLTGRYFPPSEIIYLEGKPYSAAAKPQVVASLQSGLPLVTSDIGRDGPAWEHRAQLGWMKAIIDTIKAVLLEPTRTFSTMKREGGIQDPLVYNLVVGSVGGIFFQLIFGIGQIVMASMASGQQGNVGAAIGAGMVGVIVGMIMVPIQIAMGAFIGSGILHLCLMLLKAAPRPFETTFRTMNYAYGSLAVLNLVPILGWVAMIPWSLVVIIIGVARTQEITTGKAALAVFLPAIVCCGIIFLIPLAVGAAGAGGAFKH